MFAGLNLLCIDKIIPLKTGILKSLDKGLQRLGMPGQQCAYCGNGKNGTFLGFATKVLPASSLSAFYLVSPPRTHGIPSFLQRSEYFQSLKVNCVLRLRVIYP